MTIHIDASINEENGDFIIEGQDFGPSVKEIFGDSDYEYWLTVPVAYKADLLKCLRRIAGEMGQPDESADEFLVRLVKQQFGAVDAVNRMKELCEEQGIPCKYFSY